MTMRSLLKAAVGLAVLGAIGVGGLLAATRPREVASLPLELTYTPGKVLITPHELPARSTGHHLTLEIETGPEPIQPGGRLEVVVAAQVVDMGGGPKLYAPQLVSLNQPQVRDPDKPGYVSLDAHPGPVEVRIDLPSTLEAARMILRLVRGRRHDLLPYSAKELTATLARLPLVVERAPLPGRSRLTVRVGGPAGQGVGFSAPPRETRYFMAVLVDARGDGDVKLLEQVPTLDIVGTKAVKARVVTPSIVRPERPFEVIVQAVDEHNARDVGFAGALTLEVEGLPAEWTLEFTPADRGEKRIPLSGIPAGTWRLVARAAEGGAPTLEPARQPIVARADGPLLFWGDTHRHSVLADAFLVPEEVYRRALEEEHLDWMSLSEHSHPDPFNLFGDYRKRLNLKLFEWAYLTGLSDRYDALPGFTSLTGFEWSSEKGHRNVYFHPDEEADLPPSHMTTDGWQPVPEFLRAYQDRRVLVIPHHPGWRLGGDDYEWGPRDIAQKLQRVVEVYSQHGNSEFFDNPRPIHAGPTVRLPPSAVVRFFVGDRVLGPRDQAPQGSPGFVRNALAAGLRMGLIASSDNHFMDNGDISYPGGLAAVWAETNDRASIWEGLNRRAAYGTTGARMVLELRVAGYGVGEEGKAAGAPEVEGRVLGTAPLKKVEVVRYDRNGYASALSRSSTEDRLEFRFRDDAFLEKGFYFLRVEQVDGELGWAGPIWLD